MRHAGQILDDGLALGVHAEEKWQGGVFRVVSLLVDQLAQAHGAAGFVGHLDTDGGAARDGCDDAHALRLQGSGDFLAKRRHFVHARALFHGQLEHRDRGADLGRNHLGIDAEAL